MTANTNTDDKNLPADFADILGGFYGIDSQIISDCLSQQRRESEGPPIGELIKGKGIYLGTCNPQHKENSDIFNIYAAPTDLLDRNGNRLRLTYNQACRKVAALNNWHEHKGIYCKDDSTISKWLKEKKYGNLSRWFIPTGHMLYNDSYYKDCIPMVKSKDKEALKDTFANEASSYYWSSSPLPLIFNINACDFSTGERKSFKPNKDLLYCRPVRLELKTK